MVTYDVAVIPGDGVSSEVTEAAMEVLDPVAERHGFALERTIYDWGTERYLEAGAMMPDDALDRLESADAIFLGAVGHPEVRDHVTLNGLLLPIRKGFDQYVCKRPNTLYEGIESPLRGYEGGDIDFVVYRENTEGEYANVGGREHHGFDHEVAVQSAVVHSRGNGADRPTGLRGGRRARGFSHVDHEIERPSPLDGVLGRRRRGSRARVPGHRGRTPARRSCLDGPRPPP